MRHHTIIGERILGAAPALRPRRRGSCARATSAGTAAATPTGSRGDEIPLGARIVAVCDAYDAMTADRAYRAPDAPRRPRVAELRALAGSQFDPEVVAAFIAEISSRPPAALQEAGSHSR